MEVRKYNEVLYIRVCSYVYEKGEGADLCVYVRTEGLCGNFLFSRKRTKIRKKTKYTILDNIDEQERMELRPKYGKRCLFQLGTHPPSLQSIYLN